MSLAHLHIHLQLQHNFNLALALPVFFCLFKLVLVVSFLFYDSSLLLCSLFAMNELFLHFNSGLSQLLSQLYFCRTSCINTLVFRLQINLVVRNCYFSVYELSWFFLVSCSQLNLVSVFSNFCRCIHVSQFVHSLYIMRFWLHLNCTYHWLD